MVTHESLIASCPCRPPSCPRPSAAQTAKSSSLDARAPGPLREDIPGRKGHARARPIVARVPQLRARSSVPADHPLDPTRRPRLSPLRRHPSPPPTHRSRLAKCPPRAPVAHRVAKSRAQHRECLRAFSRDSSRYLPGVSTGSQPDPPYFEGSRRARSPRLARSTALCA